MKKLIGIIVIIAIAVGVTWYAAGREPGPRIVINSPRSVIGRESELAVAIDTPAGKLSGLEVSLEQGKTRVSIVDWRPGSASPLTRAGPDRLVLTRPIGKRQVPELVQGGAEIIVTATRPVLFGYQRTMSTVTRAVKVDLTPPIISVVSTGHYIEQGGAEMVVYRVSPPSARSGVQVGPYRYPGYPATGAHVVTKDPGLRVAFFALLWNQDPSTPIGLYARDAAGNVARATFDYRVIPKSYPKSTLRISDRFLERVVPPILANDPGFKVPDPSNLVDSFVRIDHDLALEDDAEIAALARETSPRMLWSGPWVQQRNSAVEATFAEQRTFLHGGKVIGHEVHLGYDLASVAGAPVTAENSGRVVHAGWLDIYGNCVIIDHGMGVQSLYGHMSSLEVRVGQMVSKGEEIGREGETGLAGGPHVHFSMLVNGHFVTPIDWWSRKWIHDRIVRKLEAAGAPASSLETADTTGRR
jgi:murein DD-endopeptidase MepM/ murein hydrolase activator NlpD